MGPAASRLRAPALIGGLVAGGLLILWLGREASFFHDEWWYICGRALTDPLGWLRPHNEHLVAVHVVAYRLLVEGFGTGSYLPFHAALVAMHLLLVWGVFVLTRRHASAGAAFGAGAIFLAFGSGYMNLLWAFQIGFVGAAALGIWALVALPARPAVAALLLTAAVATTGVGLFFVVAAGAYLASYGRVRSLTWLVPPIATFAIWALVARSEIDVRGTIGVIGIPGFVAAGIAATGGAVIGVGPIAGLAAAGAVLGSRPREWRSPLLVACAAGILAQYVLIGGVRQGFNVPGASHYVYVAAVFALPAIATLLSSSRVRWVGPLLFSVAFSANLLLLIAHGLAWPAETAALRAAGSDVPPPGVCR